MFHKVVVVEIFIASFVYKKQFYFQCSPMADDLLFNIGSKSGDLWFQWFKTKKFYNMAVMAKTLKSISWLLVINSQNYGKFSDDTSHK